MSFDTSEIAEKAVKLLMEDKTEKTVIVPQLVVRESVRQIDQKKGGNL